MAATEPRPVPPVRRFRWNRFHLSALLIVLFVVASACYWYVDHRRLALARDDHARTAARYEVGLIHILRVCEASRTLAEAGEESWFVGSVRARAGHLLRVTALELRWRVFIELSIWGEGGREEALKTLVELVQCSNDARRWLREALGES